MKKNTVWLLTCLVALSAAACNQTADDSSGKGSTTPNVSTVTTAPPTTGTTELVTTTAPPPPTPVVDKNAITFEDGDLWTAHALAGEDYADDESRVELSVESFNGTKQLRVQVLDQKAEKEEDGSQLYKVPKIAFDVAKLVNPADLHKISKISCDLTANAVGPSIAKDGNGYLVPGNLMGALAGNLAKEKKTDADGALLQSEWGKFGEYKFDEWNYNWGYFHYEAKILLDTSRYEADFADATLVVMRWGIPNQADLFIDNITFWDETGSSIPLTYKPK